MDKNIERFIRYAKIDTQADENTGTTPSTEKQKNLSRLLVKELKELGLEDTQKLTPKQMTPPALHHRQRNKRISLLF